VKSFTLTDLQAQILRTSMVFNAVGIGSSLTDQLMEVIDELLEEKRAFEELLNPFRTALSEIHETLQYADLPPWIKPRAVRREVRNLARMLRTRNLKRMLVQFQYVVRLDIPFKDARMFRQEIEQVFSLVDKEVATRWLQVSPETGTGGDVSRKRASKKSPKKRTRSMMRRA
jgi:hypothetical protein